MFSPSTPKSLRCYLRFTLLGSLLISFFALALADTPIVRMARISLIEGEVSYRRAKHDNNWYDASTNIPLGEEDQVFTGQRGRAEIQLTGRNIVRLDAETSFKITQFTTAVTQISLPLGNAIFRIDSLDRRQFDVVDANDATRDDPLYFEINTPTVAVTLAKTGTYRICVKEDGTTEVVVRSGEAEVYNQELGTVIVKKNHRIIIEGSSIGFYQITRPQDKDVFERWNDRRDDDLAYQSESLSARYVPQGVPGVYDLDRYGDWWYTADYGYVWSPRTVAAGWSPYRVGSWRWYSDWGWTWISSEPWGWTPYHYGRWAYFRSRWCWVPRSTFSAGFSWSPALVTWFGWGNGRGYNRGYNNGYYDGYRDGRYDHVGWVPLAPGERYHNPFRGGGNTTIVNNTNIYGDGNTVVNGRLDNYRNANAPGGVIRMEGRRFDTGRVVAVNNNTDNTPIQQPIVKSAITARGDSLRPAITPNVQPELNPAANPSGRQHIERGVISRSAIRPGEAITPNPNAVGRTVDGTPTLRSADIVRPTDRTGRADRTNREANNSVTATSERVNPTNDSSRITNRADNPDRSSSDREYRRVERPAEHTVERPTERTIERPTERTIERPVWPSRRTEDNSNNTNHDRTIRPERPTYRQENRPDSPPPDYSRRGETERREMPARQAEPRREERPDPPREYRREERPAPRQEASPRYEAPPRQEAPPRYEAPPRQEAPRQMERPSPPPEQPRGGDRTERPARDNSGGRRNQGQ